MIRHHHHQHHNYRHLPLPLLLLVFLSLVSLLLPGHVLALPTKVANYTVNDYAKLRCSINPNDIDTYMEFRGNVYSNIDGQSPQMLFQILGVNVANCLKEEDGSYFLTTREIMLYLDPVTGEKLTQWRNPFTKEDVTVVHVFNDPVQMLLSNDEPYLFTVDEEQNVAQQIEDVPLFYPNPLYQGYDNNKNNNFTSYAPTPSYQGGEYFSFQVKLDDLNNTQLDKIENVHYTWTRTSQFVPFMKMGDNQERYEEGYLLFSSHGRRVSSYDGLDPILKDEIENRVPLMKHAPTCQLDIPNETSWTYFQKYFQNYLDGEEFPISVSKESASCVSSKKSKQ